MLQTILLGISCVGIVILLSVASRARMAKTVRTGAVLALVPLFLAMLLNTLTFLTDLLMIFLCAGVVVATYLLIRRFV